MATALPSHSILHREFLSRPIATLSPKPAVTIGPRATIEEAIARLNVEKVGCLLVMGEHRLLGILTERDILAKVHPDRGTIPKLLVQDCMTANPSMTRQSAGISRLLYDMAVGGFRHMPVMLKGEGSFGVLSTTDFIDRLHSRLTKRILEDDTKVEFDRNVVDEFFASSLNVLRPDAPISAAVSTPVHECVQKLIQGKRGALAILGDSQRVIGVFTERDYLRKVLARNIDSSVAEVGDYMSHPAQTLMPSATIAFAFQCLSERGFRHLPIVNFEEKLTGMISVRTVVNYLAEGILETLKQSQLK